MPSAIVRLCRRFHAAGNSGRLCPGGGEGEQSAVGRGHLGGSHGACDFHPSEDGGVLDVEVFGQWAVLFFGTLAERRLPSGVPRNTSTAAEASRTTKLTSHGVPRFFKVGGGRLREDDRFGGGDLSEKLVEGDASAVARAAMPSTSRIR